MLDLKLRAGNGLIQSLDTTFSGAADCTGTYSKVITREHAERYNSRWLSWGFQAEVDCQLHERTIPTLDQTLKLSDLSLQRAMFIEQTLILCPRTSDLFRGRCDDGGFGESFELVSP
jgi:hypothetical protein